MGMSTKLRFAHENITVKDLAGAVGISPTALLLEMESNKERGLYEETSALTEGSELCWGTTTRTCARMGFEAMADWKNSKKMGLTKAERTAIGRAIEFEKIYGRMIRDYTATTDPTRAEELYAEHIKDAEAMESLLARSMEKKPSTPDEMQ